MRNPFVRKHVPDPPKPKTPSGSGECICDPGLVMKGCPVCDKTPEGWTRGAMMIAEDDPLRDTPEKAEAYARNIIAILERKQQAETLAERRDASAALRILGAADAELVPGKTVTMRFVPDA